MAAPSSTTTTQLKPPAGLSFGGKLFFGGLTAGTFVLGCWQTQRYFEKVDMIEERNAELAMEATTDWMNPTTPAYRRKLLEGKLLHHKEVLVGPRAPPAAHCPRNGSSMGPSPMGFFVLAPLQLVDGTIVWINRGWVPRAMVPGSEQSPHLRQQVAQEDINNWDRPKGTVRVTTIQTKQEKPKITINHDYSKRPLQLFWMDPIALQAIAESETETALLTQVAPGNDQKDPFDTTASNDSAEANAPLTYPLLPSIETLADFKTTPAIHVGYAITWYGLAVAGTYMTRKLIRGG